MRLIVLIFMMFSSLAQANEQSIFPPNDLWRYDNLEIASPVSEEVFREIVKAGKDAYQFEADNRGEELVINPKWTDKTVNANACRGCEEGKAIINMFGGLARRKEISPMSFAIVLCHELGHLYGGTPYISVQYRMAAEGQADYWSTNACFEKISARVPAVRESRETYQPYAEENCGDNRVCKNALEGGQELTNLLGFLTGVPTLPTYETPDTTVVTKTQLSYPKTVQCRLDTYGAGILMKPRPACWYKSGFRD
jgi:hypothetical protein